MELSTTTLPVLPLRNGVVFPHMVVTVTVESDEARRAIAAAESTGGRLLLVPRVDGEFATVGTIAEIQEVTDGDRAAALIAGVARARIGTGVPGSNEVLWVDAEPIPDDVGSDDAAVAELAREYRAVVGEILEHRGIGAAADRILDVNDPSQLADMAVYSPDLSIAQKVEVLETIDLPQRLELVLRWMNEILADITIRRQVREEASERIDRSQREYVLRQQMEAIRKELGDSDGDVASEYRAKLADADVPASVAEAVEREIERLERMSEQSPEHSWIRTWLDTIFEVPWSHRTEDHLDLADARSVLDEDHTGLDDVKERIVEHLAVRKLRAERGLDAGSGERGSGAILLLVGPPGVGKTSLGESIARSLGRKFVRVALGGMRDEAEVRGHRRTYVGARPGRIVRALIESESMNPVFLLDEMDKVGSDWRGDPSSALLEVLDPEQNHTFRDHYLELDLDLSDVMFIATANMLETIPAPLLDRTEIIRLDGYTDREKVSIARDHLLPRQIERSGLQPEEVEVDDDALASIVDGYTREAGVRGLERQIGKLVRKIVTKVAAEEPTPIVVDAGEVRDLLGKPTVHHDEAADRTELPGVATGLAVTGAGGDVLFVEASVMEGEPGLTLTGQLGDVMKESATIALSYVRAHADELGISPERLQQRFHVHVPAGAIPKDGPSAGVTMVTALVSLLTERRVKSTIGMTGEVTLQGRVLPIGGVKQKVLAAHRAGLTEVVLPERNVDDLDDVPDQVKDEMTFFTFADIDGVLTAALEEAPVTV
ncbi:MAG: endopeptidase La [Acidimicrobiia bacterium]|nr:endopeptidase La [Acidimicrobiia bacterium]